MVLLFWLLMTGLSYAGTLTVEWQANTEPDLAGYEIHIGTASRNYTKTIPVGLVTKHTFEMPGNTMYFVAMTALDRTGNESQLSAEVSKMMPPDVPDAIVTKVAVDKDGATITIKGDAMGLRYGDDFTPMTKIASYTPGATTFRFNKTWAKGTTFTCFQAQKRNDVWTEQGCNAVPPVIDQPPPPPPPPPKKQCADTLDNEAIKDGKIDFPDDPGCTGPEDDDETDPPPPVDTVPDPPNGLILSDRPTLTEVILAWQPAARATTYAIKRIDEDQLVLIQGGLTQTSGRVALPESGRRFFVVCASNAKGETCPTPFNGVFATK